MALTLGCNSKAKPTPNNFTQTLNAYFQERPECLFSGVHFPYATSDAEVTKQMNTLVKSQMLEASYESAVHTTRYTVARAGTRYAPRFCYGHRVISSIDSFTPPAKGASGFPETHVSYHYTMTDVPVWAKSPGRPRGISCHGKRHDQWRFGTGHACADARRLAGPRVTLRKKVKAYMSGPTYNRLREATSCRTRRRLPSKVQSHAASFLLRQR